MISRAVAIGIATVGGAMLLPLLPGIRQFEDRSEDLRFRLRGARSSSSKVILLSIDGEAERAWGEPRAFWGGHLADLISRCNGLGAKKIGVDVVVAPNADTYLLSLFNAWKSALLGGDSLITPEEEGSLDLPNSRLEDAVSAAAGKIVLATQTGHDYDFGIEASAGNSLGYAGIHHGRREIVRQVPTYLQLDSVKIPSFSVKMAGRAVDDLETIRINYSGSALPTISALDLLSGKFDRELVKDAWVVIGENHRAVQDFHDTPYADLVPGMNIQAEAVKTILDGRAIERWPIALQCLLAGLVAVAFQVVAWKKSTAWFLVLVVGFAVAWLTLTQSIFRQSDLVLPVVAPLVVVGLLVPIITFPEKAILNQLKFEVADRERAQQRAQFGQFVSEAMVRRIDSHRDSGTGMLETVNAALLFVDIEGFSDKSNRLPPIEIVTCLNELLERAIAEVEQNSGYVLAFSGDGFSAVFEESANLVDARRRALIAAESLLHQVGEWNRDRPQESRWEIRVGLAFGPVSVALIGSPGRHTLSTYGPAMNLASRLEQAGKESGCRILASTEYADYVPEGYSPVPVTIKGWGQYLAYGQSAQENSQAAV